MTERMNVPRSAWCGCCAKDARSLKPLDTKYSLTLTTFAPTYGSESASLQRIVAPETVVTFDYDGAADNKIGSLRSLRAAKVSEELNVFLHSV